MYDLPELKSATSEFWLALRSELIDRRIGDCRTTQRSTRLPRCLIECGESAPGTSLDSIWLSDRLIFSQTCGYPYVTRLSGQVALVGTPDYGWIDGSPGWYDSVVIARSDDPRDTLEDYRETRFALNSPDSQSGCQAMMYWLSRRFGNGRFFGSCLVSRSHTRSIRLVATGAADLAAIDGVTWRLSLKYNPDTRGLRVLTRTEPSPGLPYICHRRWPAATIADAVEAALSGLPRVHARAMGLQGLWRSSPSDYEVIAARARLAAPVLAAHGPVMRR